MALTFKIQERKRLLIVAASLLLVGLVGAICLLWGRPDMIFRKRHLVLERMTIAVATSPMSAPFYIALDQGYFKKEGLDVSISQFSSGKAALDRTMDGKADLAACAETPIVLAWMNGKRLCIVATVAESEKTTALLVRKDRGVLNPTNLSGKAIGMTPATNGEFFLDTFLLLHDIPRDSTKVVALNPEEMGEAVSRGHVDAVAIWEPLLSKLKGELGNRAQVFFGEGFYRATWNLVGRKDYVSGGTENVKKVLRALIKAEDFIFEHPGNARQITARSLGIDKTQLEAFWDTLLFGITLDQGLILNMEDQARWVLAERRVKGASIPNFLDSLWTNGLKAALPESVDVVYFPDAR